MEVPSDFALNFPTLVSSPLVATSRLCSLYMIAYALSYRTTDPVTLSLVLRRPTLSSQRAPPSSSHTHHNRPSPQSTRFEPTLIFGSTGLYGGGEVSRSVRRGGRRTDRASCL